MNPLVILEEKSRLKRIRLTKKERDDLVEQISTFWGKRARAAPYDGRETTEAAAAMVLNFFLDNKWETR